ncbi:hypothetical protein CQ018_15990 [Arthrobacter sp. MYb227]|uniref:C40 family peptidase n=1 Tax=Arthrobacter sp. MYb227 TaxID=1848601 RepID=UPI000CFBAAD5|nr:C40 family peptidase [Arthrobacter sp. MYb227]PQZ89049.1 hypothetical protein CQ018_15990 [Arthrobacter sp. MYb227]
MSVLRHLVIATSTALVASTVLATGASAAPVPTNSDIPSETVLAAELNPNLIQDITKSMAVAAIAPATTAKSLESQIFQVDAALQDAEAVALEAAENLVVAEESATAQKISPTSLSGTSLAKFSFTAAERDRQQSAAISANVQSLYAKAETELSAKREELIRASAKVGNTTVKAETARLQKLTESREEAELMAALQDSEQNVEAPINDPALDPEFATVPSGAFGTASISGAAVQLPTAISRAKRIDNSVKWAKKIASNNKYKYRYGATGPRYFDCSGYTGKAFAAGGKKLKRTSSAQYKAAPKKVKLSKLKKGDLVFWSSNRGRSFYHVALYIGGGKIAHARNPKAGISVTKLNYAGMRNIYKYAGRY